MQMVPQISQQNWRLAVAVKRAVLGGGLELNVLGRQAFWCSGEFWRIRVIGLMLLIPITTTTTTSGSSTFFVVSLLSLKF
jgi:hypothetical protein